MEIKVIQSNSKEYRTTTGITFHKRLLKAFFYAFIASTVFGIAHAEEYVNDYAKTPKLKIYYGNNREKKFPIDVYESMPIKISDNSYTQEFDLKITDMKGGATHLFIGVYKGLQIMLLPGGRIFLHGQGVGFIAKSAKKTLERNIEYAVKISFNKTTLMGQCVVTKKDDNSVVWDTGEVLCDPFNAGGIHFAAKHIKKDPSNSKSEILWNEEEQVMTLCSGGKRGLLKANVDNMKLKVEKP